MHTDKYEGKVQKTFWLCNKDNSRAWSLKYRLIKSTRIGASQPYDVITVKNWCELLENFMFTVSPHPGWQCQQVSWLVCTTCQVLLAWILTSKPWQVPAVDLLQEILRLTTRSTIQQFGLRVDLAVEMARQGACRLQIEKCKHDSANGK